MKQKKVIPRKRKIPQKWRITENNNKIWQITLAPGNVEGRDRKVFSPKAAVLGVDGLWERGSQQRSEGSLLVEGSSKGKEMTCQKLGEMKRPKKIRTRRYTHFLSKGQHLLKKLQFILQIRYSGPNIPYKPSKSHLFTQST